MRPELGDEVKCKISGFRGIITATAQHLTGCDRICVSGKTGKDGKVPDSYWFDQTAVEILKKNKVQPTDFQEKGPKAKLGGPVDKFK